MADMIRLDDGAVLQFCRGPQAAIMAPQIWAALDDRRRDVLLWDIEPRLRAAVLPRVLEGADLCAVGWHGGASLGVGWTVPFCKGSRSALVHLAFTGTRGQAETCSRVFLNRVAAEGRMDSLVGIVPWPFRHMRVFARDLGFESRGRIPGVCCLRGHGGRVVDAEFFVWEARRGDR